MLHFNLKTYLKNKGMTISELSELTGISRNSLGLLVNGRSRGIQFDTLEKISRVIDVSINELFTISFDEIQIRTVLNNVRSSDIGINSRATYDDKILICSIDIDGKVYDFYFPYVISIKMNVLKTAESELHIKLHIKEDEFYRLFLPLDEKLDITIRSLINIHLLNSILKINYKELEEIFNSKFRISKKRITYEIETDVFSTSNTGMLDLKNNDLKKSNYYLFILREINESGILNFTEDNEKIIFKTR